MIADKYAEQLLSSKKCQLVETYISLWYITQLMGCGYDVDCTQGTRNNRKAGIKIGQAALTYT